MGAPLMAAERLFASVAVRAAIAQRGGGRWPRRRWLEGLPRTPDRRNAPGYRLVGDGKQARRHGEANDAASTRLVCGNRAYEARFGYT